MSQFIRVLADDPHNTGRKTYIYIDSGMIWKIYPIWVERGPDGTLWRCSEDHANAEILSYNLIATDDTVYSCGNSKELQKLGIEISGRMPAMGFAVNRDTQEKISFDPLEL